MIEVVGNRFSLHWNSVGLEGCRLGVCGKRSGRCNGADHREGGEGFDLVHEPDLGVPALGTTHFEITLPSSRFTNG